MASLRTLLLGASVVLCHVMPAQAQISYDFYADTKGWMVSSVSADGQFMRCAAGPSGDSAMELHYSQEGTTVVLGGVDAPDTAGSLDIDRASFEGTWYRGETGMIWFLDEGATEALRQGSSLTAYMAGQDPMSMELKGSAAVLLKLQECVARGGATSAAAVPAPVPADKPLPSVVMWPANVPPQPVEDDTNYLGANCPKWGEYASGASDVGVKAQFVNAADRAVSIYWIGFDGMLTEYAGLLPGESFDVDTFEGHAWVAKDFEGTCLGNGAIFPHVGEPNVFKLQ